MSYCQMYIAISYKLLIFWLLPNNPLQLLNSVESAVYDNVNARRWIFCHRSRARSDMAGRKPH
jgi:hypothetical protein